MSETTSRGGLYVSAAAAAAFVALAVLVARGAAADVDSSLLVALRVPDDPAVLRGPTGTGDVVRDLTSLGSEAVLVVIVGVVAAYLALVSHGRAALLVVLTVLGGAGVDLATKEMVERPRPLVVPRLVEATHASFPSGHAMLSAIVYLTLGAMLARLTESRRVKAFFFATAALLTGIVGCSRVALGVHWPTDVVAGWLLGVSWAGLCWFVAQRLQARGEVAKDAVG